jgi:putative transposase
MSPRHRPPRLATVFYDPPLYFVTICVRRRLPILATDAVHSAFQDFAMRGFDKKQIAIGRYVVMPDHLHLFVSGPREFRLEQWGRMLKLALGRATRMGRALRTSASTSRAVSNLWERGFFDHAIRNAESYAQKWEYVRQNPVRQDWPYQGEIVEIYRC